MKMNDHISLFWILLALSLNTGCASISEHKDVSAHEKYAQVEERWGVQPKSIRLTGADHFVDFRYRVTDVGKAAPVVNRNNKAFLLDQESGKVYQVPVTKIGPMRATSQEAKEDREYFVLFSNVNGEIKRGDRVTVVIGDFKAENLVVE